MSREGRDWLLLDAENMTANMVNEREIVEDRLNTLILTLPSYAQHAKVVSTAVTFLGDYSKWINCKLEKYPMLLVTVMNYFLNALTFNQASENAAKSLQTMCVSCARHLANPDALNSLLSTLESVMNAGLNIKNRCIVTEGIARIITSLQYDDCVIVLSSMTQPMLVRMEGLLGHHAIDTQTYKSISVLLSNELKSLASALKFISLDVPIGQTHPVLIIVRSAW